MQRQGAGLVADDTPQVKLLQVRSSLAAERLLVWASPPLGAGVQNAARSFRELAVVPGPTPAPAHVGLTAAYLARFGPPQASERVFVRLKRMSQGFQTSLLADTALLFYLIEDRARWPCSEFWPVYK